VRLNAQLSRLLVIFAIAITSLAGVSTALADEVLHSQTIIGVQQDLTPPQVVFRVNLYDTAGKMVREPVLRVTPSLEQATSYTVVKVDKDGNKLPVSVRKVTAVNSNGEVAGGVNILTAEAISGGFSYEAKPNKGVWQLKSGFTLAENKEGDNKPPAAQVTAGVAEVKNRTLENKFEVLNGSTVGAGSARYTYRFDSSIQNPNWFHAEATAKADFNFLSKDRHDYLNSLVAEGSESYMAKLELNRYEDPDFGGEVVPHYAIPWSLGLSESFEADQTFDTINLTGGLVFVMYANNPVTNILADAFKQWTEHEAGVAPKFKLGYTGVAHVKRGENNDAGSQRVIGDFYWSLPLVRDKELLPLVGPIDADFLADVENIYDIEQNHFYNQTKITLEIRQHTDSDNGWAYTLTYADGRATPTFQHFDAFLVGLKKLF
jgi:hypothetical protein